MSMCNQTDAMGIVIGRMVPMSVVKHEEFEFIRGTITIGAVAARKYELKIGLRGPIQIIQLIDYINEVLSRLLNT